jgi:hypothetical protein
MNKHKSLAEYSDKVDNWIDTVWRPTNTLKTGEKPNKIVSIGLVLEEHIELLKEVEELRGEIKATNQEI